jgi:hypothetical protein
MLLMLPVHYHRLVAVADRCQLQERKIDVNTWHLLSLTVLAYTPEKKRQIFGKKSGTQVCT